MKFWPASLLLLAFNASPLLRAQQTADFNYMQVAAQVATNLNRPSLESYYGWTIDAASWHDALNDTLFGPFLAAQDEKPGRALVCIMSELYNDATCVYFEDSKPYGVAALKADVDHKFSTDEVKAAFKPITPALLQYPAAKGKNKIIDGQYELDNKTMIPADIITEGAS